MEGIKEVKAKQNTVYLIQIKVKRGSAQEIEKVVPEVVFEDPDDGYKSVSYGNLTALLIEAIKEQSEEINNLKEQVKELQNGITK